MTAWRMYLFPVACAAVAIGAVLYGADAWLHLTVAAMAALCWATRRHAYDGVIRLVCAVGLSGGALALVVSAALSAVTGMTEASALSSICAALSGIAASTQARPAGRFMSGVVRFIRARMA